MRLTCVNKESTYLLTYLLKAQGGNVKFGLGRESARSPCIFEVRLSGCDVNEEEG